MIAYTVLVWFIVTFCLFFAVSTLDIQDVFSFIEGVEEDVESWWMVDSNTFTQQEPICSQQNRWQVVTNAGEMYI